MELLYNIHITGDITLETGLHIGGSEIELEIGGIDNAVAKDLSSKDQKPYIPGSSFKGKMRHLIAAKKDFDDISFDVDETFILFGEGASDGTRKNGKLLVRDFFIKDGEEFKLEDKAENTINRVSGGAKPRNIERVVKGATFSIDMMLKVYDKLKVKTERRKNDDVFKNIYEIKKVDVDKLLETIKLGFTLMAHDYIGGSGSRGYGKIKFNFENKPLQINFMENGNISTKDYDFDFNFIDENENN